MEILDTMTYLLLFILAGLLSLAFLPARRANAKTHALRKWVPTAIAVQTVLAFLMALGHGISGAGLAAAPATTSDSTATWSKVLNAAVYFDGTAGLMLLLVSFVGYVVSRYSVRYLDGEATQGRYFKWIGFTVGAVSLMIIAGNLLLFVAAWVMTSTGLHQLLLHYPDRRAARKAAWTKFAISRLGDLFLIAAMIITFQTFGSLDFSALFAQAADVAASGQVTDAHVAIAWLLMLGAVTKSAQFPFHLWLPDTMETPTPVSALMHAGIVNAGGFLVIRMSPVIALAPASLITLAVIGAVTACFGGVVMMTQHSIKRVLAYSTIAQMGFMMLQCGLGAFSAAMLHILAHSLYKAHAFLRSGSVVAQMAATRGAADVTPVRSGMALTFALATSVSAYSLVTVAAGFNLATKPGGLVLASILCIALTVWARRIFSVRERFAPVVGMVGVTALCAAYMASYLAVDHLLADAVPAIYLSATTQLLLLLLALPFGLLLILHTSVARSETWAALEPIRVHASNGFYIDAVYDRLFGSLFRS